MPLMRVEDLKKLGLEILAGLGSPPARSEWVVETLLRANLSGHDSHGIMRLLQYADFVREGAVLPCGEIEVVREMGSVALMDAGRAWGQVAAREAMEKALKMAGEMGVGMVGLRNCPHIGRLGEYVLMAAERDMMGMAFVNSQIEGDGTVLPWGGIDGRFSPAPLAFAAPSGWEWHVLVDITASVMPEGKVRDALFRGESLPPGVILDADGRPSMDPRDFYGPPMGGLLPLGGAVGHKGYALGVMIEMLAGGLTGAGYVSERPAVAAGNGVLFQAMRIDVFEDIDRFKSRSRALIAHVKSARSRDGYGEILFPGEPEHRSMARRMRDGIEVPESLWAGLRALAGELGIESGGG